MTLHHHPHRGEILTCAYDDIAIGAEMIKPRPVIVVSRHENQGSGLCTVVPLSTTAPTHKMPWHHQMPHLKVAGWTASGAIWAKCDMLSTVSLQRLRKPYTKTRHGRAYVTHVLDADDLAAVMAGVRAYLSI